jgi:hypothetical protein
MTISVEPEVLTRRDLEHGQWETGSCAPKRGLPHTDIVNRKIVVPTDDTPMSRTIRAHEMMHAKVSPGTEWPKWIAREIASKEALTVCEELRVNFLCEKAGFSVAKDLSDDGETADGERLALMGDWHSAVMFAIATAGTASSKKYLTGIRRHRRDWGPALLSIQKRSIKHFKDAVKHGTSELASTHVDKGAQLAPMGFRYTETLAEWVDRIAGMTPPEPPEEDENSGDTADTGSDGTTSSTSSTSRDKITPEEFDGKVKRALIDPASTGSIPRWGELQFGKVPLEVINTGAMGKKRVATNVGRNPRRVHRYLTDPEMRLFDRRIRAKGGIVVLDVSGSMSFNRDQIRTIVEEAPGATVIAYSWNRAESDNCWILAQDGKMYREIGKVSAGNGVDLPALQWAIKNRRRNEPVVWVSDGGVSGVGDGFHETLFRQCARYVQKNGILCASNMEEAIDLFKKMGRGQKPVTRLPFQLRRFEA